MNKNGGRLLIFLLLAIQAVIATAIALRSIAPDEPVVQIQNVDNTIKVMTFNIKGCRFTDSGFYTNMWNRIVDELITKTDVSGKRYIDVSLAGFQEVDDFCGVRNQDALNGTTQSPTEDYYLIKSLNRYFIKDKDFYVYQRKIRSDQNGDFNSFSQMLFSKYPIEMLNPDTEWPLGAKINIPGTARQLYFHVMHPRSNSASCASNKAYLDRAEVNSEGSKNIIYAGDFNARYYSGEACNSSRVNEDYTFSIPVDPKNPTAKLDIIDYVMAHKESDWEVESSIMDRTWDVKKGDTERYWSDHNPVVAILRYKGVVATPTITPIVSIMPSLISPPTIEAFPPIDKLLIDLDLNQKIDISDFALFVNYYKTGEEIIDYDKDGKTQRDIEDLSYFIQEYKKKKTDGND